MRVYSTVSGGVLSVCGGTSLKEVLWKALIPGNFSFKDRVQLLYNSLIKDPASSQTVKKAIHFPHQSLPSPFHYNWESTRIIFAKPFCLIGLAPSNIMERLILQK